MIGLALVVALAALVGGAIWWVARPTAAAAQLLAAALMLGVAGYAWQGSPGLPGRPTPPTEGKPKPPTLFQITRYGYSYRFGRDGVLLDSAANLHRMGLDDYGAGMIRAGLKTNPDSADLWTGLGDELVAQGGGMLSPAASYALDRALKLSPTHPGPWIVFGDALLHQGDYAKAAATFRALLARAPKDAAWRPQIEAVMLFAEEAAGARRGG